jgi:hypothetical protein
MSLTPPPATLEPIQLDEVERLLAAEPVTMLLPYMHTLED